MAAKTKIQNLFGSISKRYDLANHILSLGIDVRWRRVAASLTNPTKDSCVLDMCCGTGDMAAAFVKLKTPPAKVIACDFSNDMIGLANNKYSGKLKNKHPEKELLFAVKDCTATDYEDSSFDIISCGFGVRNFDDLDKGLGEMARLLKPNGRVCILEFSLPKNLIIRLLYLTYFKYILPVLGGMITGDFAAYRYLVKSVIAWDKNINLPEKLNQHGIGAIKIKPLSFGIANIYIGSKCR